MNLQPATVVVGLCTCKRPQMLRTCLDSLGTQILPIDIAVQIVVVDNEPEPNNRAGVEAFAATCKFPVHYVHQPRRGIASARNAILDKAMMLGADWIAMLDDDETADARWLANLMVEEYRHVPVLAGWRQWTFPETRPFWVPENQLAPYKEGAATKHVSTANVRFNAALVRAGLRFDETLGLAAGEDIKFFNMARAAGFESRCTNRALVNETLHAARMTYSFRMRKSYSRMVGITHDKLRETGLRLEFAKLPLLAPLGLLELMLSPIAYGFGRRRFKQTALRGGRRIAEAAAVIGALIGHRPQLYRHVAGH